MWRSARVVAAAALSVTGAPVSPVSVTVVAGATVGAVSASAVAASGGGRGPSWPDSSSS